MRELVLRGHRVVASMRSPERDGPQLTAVDADRVFATACDFTGRGPVWTAAAKAIPAAALR